jgi:hypothetical protein
MKGWNSLVSSLLDLSHTELVRTRLPEAEAERQARIEFGSREAYRERCREALSLSIFDGLRRDLRYGLRVLRKNPGLTTALCLTLGFAIGANCGVRVSLFHSYSTVALSFSRPFSSIDHAGSPHWKCLRQLTGRSGRLPGAEPLVRGPGRLY